MKWIGKGIPKGIRYGRSQSSGARSRREQLNPKRKGQVGVFMTCIGDAIFWEIEIVSRLVTRRFNLHAFSLSNAISGTSIDDSELLSYLGDTTHK